jgi:hypothetical protein
VGNDDQGKSDTLKADASWNDNYQTFLNSRLERTQGAAQQWLTTITALLGLFSVAIVVGGGKSVSDLSDLQRWLVFLAAVIVYSLAFVSVLQGALATWGGLSRRTADRKDLAKYMTDEKGMAEKADQDADEYKRAEDAVHADAKAAYRELATAKEREAKMHWHQSRLAFAVLDARTIDPPSRWRVLRGSAPLTGDAFDYRFRYERQAQKRRRLLHESRTFGILAAVLSGILAMAVLGLQTLSQSTHRRRSSWSTTAP